MAGSDELAQDPARAAPAAWRPALLALVARMEAAAGGGPVPAPLLREALRLLPPGPEAAALRADLERLAAAAEPGVRTLCTVSDAGYLPRLFALIESLEREEPGSYRLHVACLDATAHAALARLANPRVLPLAGDELERADPALAAVRPTRTTSEYAWTLKASLVRFLLERDPALDVVAYLDGDLFFFAPARALVEELGEGAALIHRHNFSPACARLEAQSGPYNAGMVAFRNDARGRAVVDWWRERCLEWCFNRFEDGRFADQTYLAEWRQRFAGVVETPRLGVGTALWSHGNAAVAPGPGGAPHIGGERIVFFHMHGFGAVRPGVYVPSKDLFYQPTLALVRHCYLPYVKAVERGEALAAALAPGFSPPPGFDRLTPAHALVARRALRPLLAAAGVRHPIVELDAEWDCHAGPQLVG